MNQIDLSIEILEATHKAYDSITKLNNLLDLYHSKNDADLECRMKEDQEFFRKLDAELIPESPFTLPAPMYATTPRGYVLVPGIMVMEEKAPPDIFVVLDTIANLRGREFNPDTVIFSPYELAVVLTRFARIVEAALLQCGSDKDPGDLAGHIDLQKILGCRWAWSPWMYRHREPSSYVIWVMEYSKVKANNFKAAIPILCNNLEEGIK